MKGLGVQPAQPFEGAAIGLGVRMVKIVQKITVIDRITGKDCAGFPVPQRDGARGMTRQMQHLKGAIA